MDTDRFKQLSETSVLLFLVGKVGEIPTLTRNRKSSFQAVA
jgi:hypothetical protein